MKIGRKRIVSILVGITMLLSSMALFGSVNVNAGKGGGGGSPKGGSISASNEFGQTTDTFDIEESVFVTASGLTGETHYEAYVVPSTIDEDDNLANADVTIGPEKFTTNLDGELEINVIWWYPHQQGTFKIVVDTDFDGLYDSEDLSCTITVSEESIREVHATDEYGNRDSGFYWGDYIPGEGFTGEPIYTKGGFFPGSTEVEIYVVDDKVEWIYGYPLEDKSGGAERVFIPSTGDLPKTCIWPSPLMKDAGIYDIVVDVDLNGFFSSGDVVSSGRLAGITIAGEPPPDGHLEDEIASFGYFHQDYFEFGQKVYAYINPSYRDAVPPGSQADIYVYLDRHWHQGDPLNDDGDVSGGPETITPQYYCNNQWLTLVWPSAIYLEHGYYDIIIDCNQNGIYDVGIDLLDKNWGFGFTLTGRDICASNTFWQRVDTFDIGESVFMEARGLMPATHYNVYVVPGTITPGVNLESADVSGGFKRFTTNMMGELEGNIVWWYPSLSGMYKIVVDDNHNGLYDVVDLHTVITVTDLSLCEVYPTDAGGIFDAGFFFGESVYAKGSGFPPTTYVAVYVTEDNLDWAFNDPLIDISGGAEVVQTTALGNIPVTNIWPTVDPDYAGVYDIIVDTDQNGILNLGDALFNSRTAGITLQGEGESGEHLEDEIAAYWVGSPDYCHHKDYFHVGENVYAYVNPEYRSSLPKYGSADIYVFLEQSWMDQDPLIEVTDVSGGSETLTPNHNCDNAYYILIWPYVTKVDHGFYDVVIDFDQDGVYDIGHDLLDKHLSWGFTLEGNEDMNILYSDDVEAQERQWETLDDTGTPYAYQGTKCWYSDKGTNIRHDLQRKLDFRLEDTITSMTVEFRNTRDLNDDPNDGDTCGLYLFAEGIPIGLGTTWTDDTTTDWQEDTYDPPPGYLQFFENNWVTMDFMYETDGDYMSEGWWIDNVKVYINGDPTPFFEDDMESGQTGWQADGWQYGYKTGAVGDYWHISTRDCRSTDNSWWCGDEGTGQYISGLDNSLEMISVPLLQHQEAWLEFWAKYDFYDTGDYVDLEIRPQGAPTWTLIQRYSGISGWTKRVIDLTGYAGQVIQLRYHMKSDASGVAGGMFLDDIEILVDAAQVAEWTYIAYFDGDNNLESCMIADLNELEFVGSTTHVNFFLMLDRYDGYNHGDPEYHAEDDDISNGNWDGTRTYYITKDDDGGLIKSFQLGPELDPALFALDAEHNMGVPSTLTAYADWVMGNYPANKYVVVLSDHGGGIDGVCWDEKDGGDNLAFQEIETGMSHISNSGSNPVEVLQLSVCLCQMTEMAYELRDDTTKYRYADYIVASEEVSWGTTVPNGNFENVAQYLVDNWNTVTGRQLSIKMVDEYYIAYNFIPSITMSSIDMAYIGDPGSGHLIGPLDDLAFYLTEALNDPVWKAQYKVSITDALIYTDHYADFTNIDLYQFAEWLENTAHLPPTGPYNIDISDAADGVMTCLSNTVVHNVCTAPHHDSYGLAIYFADTSMQYSTVYDPLDLPNDTYWNYNLFNAYWIA
jgi:hypothetical protein